MADTPLARYRARRQAGELKPDPAQELAAEKLESLHHALVDYRRAPEAGASLFGWRERFGLGHRPKEAAPQGLYLFGGVGRGKSMLMDMFFETAPVAARRRVHFHAFMLETHDRIHKWRQAQGGAKAVGPDDALPELARRIADEATLLCFDEFHVTDIADAMILGRLFTQLFDHGVVVVATSNWAPDDLYKDGLQRQRFVPFIDLMKEKLDILHLEGEIDHRRARIAGIKVYHHPLGAAADRALADAFAQLTDGAEPAPDELILKGRTLAVPKAARGVAWFGFDDLCRKPVGAADYLAIATHFHTVVLDGVPRLKPEERNETKRLMLLIDSLYEHKVKLVLGADGPPEALYPDGLLAFEFQRTVSRLTEMQAADYLALPHLT